ncbi:protein FAM200A-like [Watersipora subatra]|uniref:protein FAM200A-like n=1 Tax=Watersipora subatra TaxID=2589382 RepID=UPI00355B630A
MAPYSHSELFTECMVSAVKALYPEKLDIQQAVQWLSKGRALQRVWSARQHIEQFLSEIGGDAAERFLEILRSEHLLRDMAFLTDILAHLNDLNLKLQGKGRNVVEL